VSCREDELKDDVDQQEEAAKQETMEPEKLVCFWRHNSTLAYICCFSAICTCWEERKEIQEGIC